MRQRRSRLRDTKKAPLCFLHARCFQPVLRSTRDCLSFTFWQEMRLHILLASCHLSTNSSRRFQEQEKWIWTVLILKTNNKLQVLFLEGTGLNWRDTVYSKMFPLRSETATCHGESARDHLVMLFTGVITCFLFCFALWVFIYLLQKLMCVCMEKRLKKAKKKK